jgi:hypothetical protein
MNIQQDRTLQEAATSLSVPDVISAAKVFFARRNNIYAAFVEREGPSFVSLRGQGGEEVLIGAVPASEGAGTRVTGSSYLFDQQIARFFATLPPVAQAAS